MKKIIELSPIYTIMIFFCSYIINDNYYKNFGIDISKYVEFSDLLLFTLPLIRDLMLAILTAIIVNPTAFSENILNLIKSPRKLVIKAFLKKHRDENNLTLISKKKSFRETFLQFESDAIGLHLTTDIFTLIRKNSRSKLSVQELKEKRLQTIVLVVLFIAMWVLLVIFWLYNFGNYQKANSEFISSPLTTAFFLIGIPIGLLVGTLSLFGIKHFTNNYYKHVFNVQTFPAILIVLVTFIGIIINKSKVSAVNDSKTFDYIAIYKANSISKSSKSSKFIGRTKNHAFLLEAKNVKAINISDADSIVTNLNNKIL